MNSWVFRFNSLSLCLFVRSFKRITYERLPFPPPRIAFLDERLRILKEAIPDDSA